MALSGGFEEGSKYFARDFYRYFTGLMTKGVRLLTPDALQVYANGGMEIVIKPGFAYSDTAKYAYNDSDYILTAETADGVANRIDRVVLRWGEPLGLPRLFITKGEYATTPVGVPPVRDGTYCDLVLAEYTVNAGTVEITQAMITDMRFNDDLCGIVVCPIDHLKLTTAFEQVFAQWELVRDVFSENQVANVVALIAQYVEEAKKLKVYGPGITDKPNSIIVTESGNVTIPEGVTKVDVWLVSGGESGVWTGGQTAQCGGGGRCKLVKDIDVIGGNIYPVIIGAGGAVGAVSQRNLGGDTSIFGESTATEPYSYFSSSVTVSQSTQTVEYNPLGTELYVNSGNTSGYARSPHVTYGSTQYNGGSVLNPYNNKIYGKVGAPNVLASNYPNEGRGGTGVKEVTSPDASVAGGSGVAIIYYQGGQK